ncbi:MAG: guanylate kinase [Candidatus Omnitrophica bacterium]|nr:guanylate kinase [Candidatus Omnitrophota bacterium]
MKADRGNNKQGKIFVISGPSGSGKTTLLARLIKDRKAGKLLKKSRSVTTRPKRSGEKEGKDYSFVNSQEFKCLLKEKKILEWTRYLGYYYGTPREPLEKQLLDGKSIGLCLDLNGARIIKKLYPARVVTIFIIPPSLHALKERIRGRCRGTDQKEVRERIFLARKELKSSGEFDYRILNQSLPEAIKELKNIFWKETAG